MDFCLTFMQWKKISDIQLERATIDESAPVADTTSTSSNSLLEGQVESNLIQIN